MQEKRLEVNKDLFFTFVDLEKAYDRIPREGRGTSLKKLARLTYHDARTVVRTKYGRRTNEFAIQVGLNQGLGLSPFIFTVILTSSVMISEAVYHAWELLFADDLALIVDSEEELQEELQEKWSKWQEGMEGKGLKVNESKTEVMVSLGGETEAHIKDRSGEELKQVKKFKYLGLL